MNQYAVDAWIRSGQAAVSAKGLAWFVVIVLVGIGVVLWNDARKDK